MKTNRCHLTQIFLVLFVFLIFSNSVQAETTECTAITSLPYTITTQGIYCLTSDLSTAMTTGNAITIANNNVVIDLNGHKLGGQAAGTGTNTFGIYAYQRKNITIRNGTIRGFRIGVVLSDNSPYTASQGHIVEDIRADMNIQKGIQASGRGNIIRNNLVVDTGGQIGAVEAIGAYGPGSRVLNNDVYETKEQPSFSAAGIDIFDGDGSVVMNNRIGNQAFGGGTSIGISIGYSDNVTVKSNTISKMTRGIYILAPATGLYGDNLVSGCTTPFTGGTPAGTTNYSN